MLIASIFFYLWGEPDYLYVMLTVILISYAGSIGIDKCHALFLRRAVLFLVVLADLGALFYFKYFNFAVEAINDIFSTKIAMIKVVMPIGISFYTFQALSYVVDVYGKKVKVQRNFFDLALYISLFPQLIAGPIIKYGDISNQIDDRNVVFADIVYGIKRFIIGLAKKMLIADTLGAVADKIFSQPVEQFDAFTAWIGAIAYSFQLFYDFSGYSDMAIGLGAVFGFKFLENFNYPYISKSITEFWRRWHIALSSWFKEYLYIPLGGNRGSKIRHYINLLIVFLVTGLWHGAAWNFLFWGAWHGIFIVFEKMTNWHKEKNSLWLTVIQHIYCIFVFVIGWVVFRADTMTYAKDYLKNMFGLIHEHKIIYGMVYYIDNIEKIAFIAAILCATPLFGKMLSVRRENYILRGVINIWLLLLFVMSTSAIAASSYSPFIYFRF